MGAKCSSRIKEISFTVYAKRIIIQNNSLLKKMGIGAASSAQIMLPCVLSSLILMVAKPRVNCPPPQMFTNSLAPVKAGSKGLLLPILIVQYSVQTPHLPEMKEEV